ncbi:MAG TPA: hypothetical protein VFA60_07620 [Terriglobales bacterium]|nr:hypothetical protein [Terriglobales bacterium]
MKRKFAIGLVIAVMAMGSAAFAQNRGGQCHRRAGFNINQRQRRQQDRIAQGIRNGSLSASEAARLERQEAGFARIEARDRRSGDGLSLREREQLYRDQNRLSREIRHEEHDND